MDSFNFEGILSGEFSETAVLLAEASELAVSIETWKLASNYDMLTSSLHYGQLRLIVARYEDRKMLPHPLCPWLTFTTLNFLG